MPNGRLKEISAVSLAFPSDRLTIGALRSAFPELFDADLAGGRQPRFFLDIGIAGGAEDVLGAMLYTERLLAKHAYAKAAGQVLPEEAFSLAELREELVGRYVRFGIAQGPAHAAELIRGVERQAAALVHQR